MSSSEEYGKDIPINISCAPASMGNQIFHVDFHSVLMMRISSERMNCEVLYLVAVFVVGCIAITFRAIMFNLAGERFVARLRKQVRSYINLLFLCPHFFYPHLVIFCYYQARNGFL